MYLFKQKSMRYFLRLSNLSMAVRTKICSFRIVRICIEIYMLYNAASLFYKPHGSNTNVSILLLLNQIDDGDGLRPSTEGSETFPFRQFGSSGVEALIKKKCSISSTVGSFPYEQYR